MFLTSAHEFSAIECDQGLASARLVQTRSLKLATMRLIACAIRRTLALSGQSHGASQIGKCLLDPQNWWLRCCKLLTSTYLNIAPTSTDATSLYVEKPL